MGRISVEIEGSALTTFAAVSAADITDTTATAVKAATSGSHYEITDITVSNMHATQGTRVDIKSGTTLIWSGPAAANGGGFDHSFSTPLVCGLSEAINVVCATTGAAVRAAVNGRVKVG